MKTVKLMTLWGMVAFIFFTAGCSGGGGSGGSGNTGSLTMSVTDAKPLLPDNVTHLFVEFSEIWVHKSGGGWKKLTLAESPYTIDLLQFQDGNTTQLVPPIELDSGRYTQVRIVVDSATIRFNNDETTDEAVEIPSEHLKTDQNFTLNLAGGSAIDMVIHFDLSKSVVVTGTGAYQLKPVFHLFEDPLLAATIEGSIDNESFGESERATISVLTDSDEIYTQVEVEKSDISEPTSFRIFWIVPDQTYTVQVDFDQDGVVDFEVVVEGVDLPPGGAFELNEGAAI
ncbi:MAG: DUF4382 domain-containing protein [Desulfobacteraceae bacterium]|jgi:hypothetical protein